MANSESEDDLFDSESLLEDQISNEVSSFKITVISPERRINENTGGLRDDIYTAYQVESGTRFKKVVYMSLTGFQVGK